MTLVLQIENYDILEDGGPASITLNGRGCQVGRSGTMDWVLPDPSRHISGHHFEITFQGGQYWLSDVSTNGTFLKGQRYRLEGPHPLQHHDRFQVGHYIVIAMLGADQAAQPPVPAPSAGTQGVWGIATPGEDDGDPWAVGGVAASPIDPAPVPRGARRDDFAGEFIANPVPSAPLPQRDPPPHRDPLAPPPAGPDLHPVAMPRPEPAMRPEVVPAPRATDRSAAPSPAPDPGPDAGALAKDNAALVAAFCRGAGLPPEAYGGVDAEALAEALGRTMRIATTEVMALLQARASAKEFTRAGERTMRGASDNNPLKFMPDPAQAIEAMFLKPRAGFLTGPDGMTEALSDVRHHQLAVFAAIQPSLAQLLEDIAPEAIEKDAGGGVLGGGKRARSWDIFVERWDKKTQAHENGVLDEFLSHFARAYAEVVRKK